MHKYVYISVYLHKHDNHWRVDRWENWKEASATLSSAKPTHTRRPRRLVGVQLARVYLYIAQSVSGRYKRARAARLDPPADFPWLGWFSAVGACAPRRASATTTTTTAAQRRGGRVATRVCGWRAQPLLSRSRARSLPSLARPRSLLFEGECARDRCLFFFGLKRRSRAAGRSARFLVKLTPRGHPDRCVTLGVARRPRVLQLLSRY